MDRPTQAGMPFKMAWWSFDLGKYRPCDGTYCFYPYESLPPIPEVDGTLSWLGSLDATTDQMMQVHRNAPEARGNLERLIAEAEQLGLGLPQSFLRLMGSPKLQDRIPSSTACYFVLSEHIVPSPGTDGGYVIRFLNDQQDVLLWHLYVTREGDRGVLVSPYPLDELASPDASAGLGEDDRQAIIANTYLCAPSFEAFIYRFWLENVIWFKVSGGNDTPLTEDERRYLAHYGAGAAGR
jgi:hypothetical protein